MIISEEFVYSINIFPFQETSTMNIGINAVGLHIQINYIHNEEEEMDQRERSKTLKLEH